MNHTMQHRALSILFVIFVVCIVVAVLVWLPAALRQSQAQSYIGLTEEQAKKKAARDGLRYRLTSVDGKHLLVTADCSPSRINISLNQGHVESATLEDC